MSQRNSGYVRQPDDVYETPHWVTRAVVPYLRECCLHCWDPANGPASKIADALRDAGFRVVATNNDFLTKRAAPAGVDAIVTNPPYGAGGKMASRFIEHAVELAPIVAMLLRIDYDSGRTRTHLFRDNPAFAQKIVLLDRIVWFVKLDAPGPSENHAWFVWDRQHRGPPTIAYASNDELKSRRIKAATASTTTIDEIMRGYMDAQSRILAADSGRNRAGRSR
jgi:hypothetical protein